MINITNIVAESIVRVNSSGRFLDKDNISWRLINNEWIGKRSVWTKDFRACWLEETTKENVKTWLLGKDADYQEIFKRV